MELDLVVLIFSGNLLYSWAESFEQVDDISLLEGVAIRLALIKAKAEGWDSVKILSSNKFIVDKIINRAPDDVRLGTLLEDIISLSDRFSWCWSALAAGAVFGWTFGQEITNHHLQLYRLDTMAAQTKFTEWWQKKVEGQ
ncbi:hypothetical protein ACH5RR_009593 [Cinchona calisaya]|uniref:RNase H type-1 domain-containing protein n=1 Tax=Cinchona calisaya TaxID=153742 RepID=A0ABD3AEQ2_9GENT